MTAFGEILPYHDNHCRLDRDKKDKHGLPLLVVNAVVRENERKMDVALGGAFQVEPHGEIFCVVGIESNFMYDMYGDQERAERAADLMTLAASR